MKRFQLLAARTRLWQLVALAFVGCGPDTDADETSDPSDAESTTPTSADDTTSENSNASSDDADSSFASSSDDPIDTFTDSATSGGGTDDSLTTSDDDSTHGTSTEDVPAKIALVQFNADKKFGEIDTLRDDLTQFATMAVDGGAKIIVFPEGSSYGYASKTEVWCKPGESMFSQFSCRTIEEVAQDAETGETTMYWADFARRNGVFVVYWLIEQDGSKYYNALGVVGPEGFVASYRKRSLYYIDEAYASAGDAPGSFETPWGKFGLLICLDGNASDTYYQEYLDANVDAIILAMDWDQAPEYYGPASSTFRARAARHNIRIFAADVSPWDGTGLYLPGDVPRERNGLSEPAVGIDGISFHELDR